MTREEAMKKTAVFYALGDAFNKATGKTVEVNVNTYMVYNEDGTLKFSTPDVNSVIRTMLVGVRDYLMEV